MVKHTSSTPKGYLIWDFDGTLALRNGGWTGALLQVLKESHPDLKVTPEQIHPYLQSGFHWHAPENDHPGLSADEWWEDLYPVFIRAFRAAGLKNNDAFALASRVRMVYPNPHEWQCYPDTLKVLKTLASRGWKHILLSNHTPELPALLEHLRLKQHFAAVFNSAETGYEKPNPKAFRQVRDWMGPGITTWMIGDSYSSDIAGARQAGLPAILVHHPNQLADIYCETLSGIADKI